MPLLPIVMGMAQFAPSVMRFFGAGQASMAVAEQVASVAQSVTGASTPAEALDMLKANAQMQMAFQQRVIELDASMELAYLSDVQNARARDIAYVEKGMHNTRADLMVLFDVIGLISCLAVLAFFRQEIPPEVVTLLGTIASIFGLCLRDAHTFEFGSSRGSREKDALMASQTTAAIANKPVPQK